MGQSQEQSLYKHTASPAPVPHPVAMSQTPRFSKAPPIFRSVYFSQWGRQWDSVAEARSRNAAPATSLLQMLGLVTVKGIICKYCNSSPIVTTCHMWIQSPSTDKILCHAWRGLQTAWFNVDWIWALQQSSRLLFYSYSHRSPEIPHLYILTICALKGRQEQSAASCCGNRKKEGTLIVNAHICLLFG